MQFLYQVDLRRDASLDELDAFLDERFREADGGDADIREFARRLVTGTLAQRPAIDDMLRRVARNWDLHRMAAVDRNVLRMAVWEMLYGREAPPKVIINEAIELGKRYSTPNSGAFINGILDRIRLDHCAAPDGDRPEPERPA